MSAEDALSRYYGRLAKSTSKRRRKNARPEWELTKKPCMRWFEANGWSMTVVESRAVFNPEAGIYTAGMANAGTPDSLGCTPEGLAAAVEFKAPGKRSTLKRHQYTWLKEKIMKGAFAVCVDSAECLEKVWQEFSTLRRINPMLGRNLLLKHLPIPPDQGDRFDDILSPTEGPRDEQKEG